MVAASSLHAYVLRNRGQIVEKYLWRTDWLSVRLESSRLPVTVIFREGSFPQWGAGGRELFYVSPDHKLMSVALNLKAGSVEPGTPRELFGLPTLGAVLSPYEATRDGQRFLVLSGAGPAAVDGDLQLAGAAQERSGRAVARTGLQKNL
jgi:hypothetical protein